ncbi:MAG: FlgO family outer membrane protein [Candidatus Sericytochromatia bacterium]
MRWLAALTLGVIYLVGLPGQVGGQTAGSAQAATDQASARRRMMILPFRNLTRQANDDWLGDSFSESLLMGLGPVSALQLVERSELQHLVKEQALMQSLLADPDSAPRLGRLVGADYVAVGTYQRLGERIQVNVRLVHVETGEIDAASLTQVQGSYAQLFEVQQELAARLVEKLQLPQRAGELQAMRSALDDSSRSTRAQQLYLQARAQTQQDVPSDLQTQTAIGLLEQAVAEDSRYGLAYAALSEAHAARAASPAFYPSAQANDGALALRYAEQALALSPEQLPVLRAHAKALKAMGRDGEALQVARRVVAEDPSGANINWYLRWRFPNLTTVDAPLLKQIVDQVEQEIHSLGGDPDDPLLLMTLASLAWMREMPNESPDLRPALALLDKAEKLRPGYAPMLLLRASLHLVAGNLPEMVKALDTTLALDPDNPLLMYLTANLLRYAEPERARQLFNASVAKTPDFAYAHTALGATEQEQFNNFAGAEPHFQRALELAPQNGDILYQVATAYLKAKRPETAAIYLERAVPVTDKPLQLFVRKSLAETYLNLGRTQAARALLEALLSESTLYAATRGEIHQTLAVLAADAGAYRSALDHFQTFVNYSARLAKSPRALRQYRRYWLHDQLQQHPDQAPLYNDLGQLYLEGDDLAKAQPLLEKAAQLAPDNAVILTNLGVLQLRLTHLLEAEALLRRAVALNPDSVSAHYQLGLVLQQRQQPDAARRAFERVLQLQPEHAEARQQLGS